jgi:hypothetical protein
MKLNLSPTAQQPGHAGRRERARALFVALLAGGIYGGWAASVNHGFGAEVALRAGLMQAALSTISTFLLIRLLERLFRWPSNPLRGFWFSSLATVTIATACMAVGHLMVGTPRIAPAIAPSLCVGAAFVFTYAYGLLRSTRARAAGHERRR